MKRILLILTIVCAGMCCCAANTADNDTIAVNNARIEQVIIDETTNSKGKPVTKYYFKYDHQLIPTSKTVVERYNLCKRHGAECALAMVVNRSSHKKRIILN